MIQISSYGIVPLVRHNEEWKVLLILHREGNHWGFPKGKSEKEELPQEAAQRELEEETGLKVLEFLKLDSYTESYRFRRVSGTVLKTVVYFAAVVGGTLHLHEEEIRDAKWLSIDEALARLSFKQARQVLIHYATLLKIPFEHERW
jgi:8-oxo-dGTP pyrophosphatase MutT (NUDIX family)